MYLASAKEETDKKPDTIDIAQYKEDGSVLPLGAHYTYYGNPTQTVAGYCRETDNDFIAVCIYHWNDSSTIVLYVKDALDRYVYTNTFRSNEASNALEQTVANLFTGMPVTYEQDGLMRASDKMLFDDVVTEVFPLTVAIESSNAGTYEIGDAQHSVTPEIQLSITRKGSDVASSANVVPSSGNVSSNKKVITNSAIYSGTKTINVTVVQGGQTKLVSATWKFLNYRYYGVINSATEPSAAQIKTMCENGTLTKQLSSVTTMGDTALAANKCYVFVVPGTNISLNVKNAKSGNVISGCTTGTVTIKRVNGTDDVACKYVIVPASAISWNFMITN